MGETACSVCVCVSVLYSDVLCSNSFSLCLSGEVRAALKWADGKILKNEVDMQVCVCVCACVYKCFIIYVILLVGDF